MAESIGAMPAIKASSTKVASFDREVVAIRASGIAPRHKPFGKNKADCTPEEWAAHLEWRATYYASHRDEWDMYRNRWLARKR